MKAIASAAMAAIIAREAIVTGAAKITPRDATLDPICVWGGTWPLVILGDTYLPLGDRAFAQQTSGALGGIAQGLVLTLSKVEFAALQLLDPAEVQDAAVVVRRVIFAADGKTLLDTPVYDRGRGDAIDSEETSAGEAVLRYMVESTARALKRYGGRMRADYDQRLISATDGYYKFVAYAAEKMLYWGGKRPSRAGDATGGGITISQAMVGVA